MVMEEMTDGTVDQHSTSNPTSASRASSATPEDQYHHHQSQQPLMTLTPQIARQLGLNYCLSRTAAEIISQADFVPQCMYQVLSPRQYTCYEVSIWSDIGNRRTQEDRSVFCPQLIRRQNDTGFFGVFDGTVGDFASENVKLLVVPHLIGSPPWPRIVELIEAAERQGLRKGSMPNEEETRPACNNHSEHLNRDASTSSERKEGSIDHTANEPSQTAVTDKDHRAASTSLNHQGSNNIPTEAKPTRQEIPRSTQADEASSYSSLPVLTESLLDVELPPLMSSAMDWMYLNSDTELVQLCSRHDKHYSSCTSVTVLILAGYCCIGHLGDSRVALGYQRMGLLYGEFLTLDHKPNMPCEQDRIMRSGGSVEYLHNHNNKPFIRGGDFTMRKAKGDQPMQLQYSRAFGGKDLKRYGLSNEPDLRVFKIDSRHNVLILASDGVWDVQTAAKAVEIVLGARRRGDHPALALINATLQEQRIKNQNADNLTSIVLFLDQGKVESKFKASSTSSTSNMKSDFSYSERDQTTGAVYHYSQEDVLPTQQQQYNSSEFH